MQNEKYTINSRTPVGLTDFRNEHIPFYIKDEDRLRHLYVIGKSGVGKTSLALNLAISDIQKGKGICFLDPHGDAVSSLLDYVPKERIQEVVYFNPADTEYPIAFNPLHNIPPENHHMVVSNLISTFEKVWEKNWGTRLSYILKHCLQTLLWYPSATLLDIQPLLTNKSFREEVLRYVKDVHIKLFWYNEYDKYLPGLRSEAISPILNKTGVFISNPILRNMVGQQGSIDIRDIVDSGKILLCNLSKGEIGEEVSSLLGSMILSSLQHAVLQRVNQREEERKPFYCYVDECGSYLTGAIINILSEARKFKLSLFLAHQYLGQLTEDIRSAIFGNVGTIISFQIGNNDAEVLAKEFHPVFTASDFINLPRYSMYLKLMIDGVSSDAFSAISLPVPQIQHSYKEQIIEHSRKLFKFQPPKPPPVPIVHKESTQHSLF